jgi:hypothetical protein
MAIPAVNAAVSPAAGQLLGLVQNPAMLSSLTSLATGSPGKSTVPVGQQGVAAPVGALMGLLSTLANQAAQDAEAIFPVNEAESLSYLTDSNGNLICDPSVPTERGNVLLRLLQQMRKPSVSRPLSMPMSEAEYLAPEALDDVWSW